jgi:very-short-patch-repair endonuclease
MVGSMPSPRVVRARHLRNNMTKVEWRLWSRLRGKQLGARFRRQHPIGPYVADFACVNSRLVIEIDGEAHLEAYDSHRDEWLRAQGWQVLHFSVQDIDEGFEAVVEAIYWKLHAPHPDSLRESDLPTR